MYRYGMEDDCIYIPQPIRDADGAGATDSGPRDIMRDCENPDVLIPPITDSGIMPNLKFSFSDAKMQLYQGGWAREVTVRELPIATALAGVNMRLTPGGVRELHWHKQVEWGFVLVGSARLTSVDQNGRNFIGDVGAGDIWYFPEGIPHSIQGLEEGVEFLLVFDDGYFSEQDTFSISGWFVHTPEEVLVKNFGVPENAFRNIPQKKKYMFQSKVPGPIVQDEVKSPYGTVPKPFTHRFLAQEPVIKTAAGTVRIVDSTIFPISTKIAAALVEVNPGAMRELHWHPNADEWQYYISGQGRMTVFASKDTANTFDYRSGDVGYVPQAMGHYVENTGDTSLWYLEIFKSDRFEDISLNQWMALTPRKLVADNLNVGPNVINALDNQKRVVVK